MYFWSHFSYTWTIVFTPALPLNETRMILTDQMFHKELQFFWTVCSKAFRFDLVVFCIFGPFSRQNLYNINYIKIYACPKNAFLWKLSCLSIYAQIDLSLIFLCRRLEGRRFDHNMIAAGQGKVRYPRRKYRHDQHESQQQVMKDSISSKHFILIKDPRTARIKQSDSVQDFKNFVGPGSAQVLNFFLVLFWPDPVLFFKFFLLWSGSVLGPTGFGPWIPNSNICFLSFFYLLYLFRILWYQSLSDPEF